MWKSILAVPLIAWAAMSATQDRPRPVLPLASAALWVECVQGGEVVVHVEVENDEPVERLRVLKPDGSKLLDVAAFPGHQRGLGDFKAELSAASLSELLATTQDGMHEIRATTPSGRLAVGRARLALDLPRAPVVVYPPPKATGVPVQGLVVRWLPESEARGGMYVELEQGDSDGLTVHVPAGQNSFRVPDGLLRPGTLTHLEVASIDASGNRMVVEIPFMTR